MLNTSILPYRYEFNQTELPEIRACVEQHGFAIVKQLLPLGMIEMLKAEVRRVLEDQAKASNDATHVSINFIEVSPVFASLMTHEPFMSIARELHHHVPMTLNRSAAIYKKPGAGPMQWHTDWGPLEHPYGADAILNNSGASSMWFYLNGIDSVRGGLAIIPDSHTENWAAPDGFEFTARRGSFHRKGSDPIAHGQMEDVPGAIPVIADPGDLIIFAERTYHGVYAHRGSMTRLSCGMSFCPRSYEAEQTWPLPESAQRFIDSCSDEVKPLVEKYLGINRQWISSSDS
ncbi:phytanoyl-CoA dioxygenase family protein [Paenibacillus mendelii]|uniref:Phytanoyl-CoA dioxygenase family protein n=1 Tax=Paenibacillus mendelii TaxID=206163 RepID=A0ABV6JEY3_9BACL|nr:phytanoyl-CoA dioxygenase family protein [Paenibacillus mendelii]MCQ6557353.1 phytanoyl-CoA dioxygenase family protein [Paenibacillus mendelii]